MSQLPLQISMNSKKQHIRLWYECLQICYSQKQFSDNLKKSKSFYEEWGDVKNTKFDNWWKEYKILFDDGAKFGMKINYILQPIPKGIPEAFILSEKYIKNKNVCLILGDNFFYGNGLSLKLINLKKKNKGATILGFKVQNPSDYGVIKLKKNKIINIIEKPKTNISNYAVTGLYFFDKNVVDYTYKLKPSKRGELEITDLNKIYLSNNKLNYEILDRGFTWLDTGNPEYLLKATQFVNILEERQGVKIACIEEIAYRNNWISKKDLKFITKKMNASNYKDYLVDLVIKG